MSIPLIVTNGLGNGTFSGTVAGIVLQGFESGAAPSNNAPVEDSVIGNMTLYQGYTYDIDISGHFSDPDGDNLSFALQSGTLPGNLSLTSGGRLQGTLDASDTAGSPYASIVIRVTDDAVSPLYVDATAFTITVTATIPTSSGQTRIGNKIGLGV